MTSTIWRILSIGTVAAVATSACVGFADEDAETDTGTDTAVPDTATDTVAPDVDDAGAETDEGSGAPAFEGNQALGLYEAPPACDDSTLIVPPIEIARCDYSFSPPPWQESTAFGTAGLLDLRQSCGTPSGEGAAPTMVHLTYPTSDADSSVAALWMTDYATTASDMRLGTSPDALDRWVRGFSFSYSLLDAERRVHEVHVCDLQPSTTYYYQVGGGDVWSETYSFTTAPTFGTDESFTFAATGDSRSTTQAMWAQTLDEIEALGADFLVFTGDAVEVGSLQFQWDTWWGQGSANGTTQRLAALPMLYAHGNHDLVGDPMWAMMAYPNDEQSYYVRYGNTLFIVLDDSGTFRTNQRIETEIRAFLEEALEAHPDVTWRVVAHHKPVYSASTNHGSTRVLQENWMPVYEEYGVDLVFNGHDHNYERSCAVRGGQCQASGDGTTYIVTAGIGAPLYGNGTDWWTEISYKVPSFVIMEVNGNTMTGTAYDPTTGTELDAFTLTKR